jgi:hypothetical protein
VPKIIQAKRNSNPRRPERGTSSEKKLRKEIAAILEDSEGWLNTPNSLFGGKKPGDLFGTADQYLLERWVGSVKAGIMS